jgi:3-keto-L-gulonate-6-phosphate decarboxylase
MNDAKTCECGGDGGAVETRRRHGIIHRKYKCKICGEKWATTELKDIECVRVNDSTEINKSGGLDLSELQNFTDFKYDLMPILEQLKEVILKIEGSSK